MTDELHEWQYGIYLGTPIRQWPADIYLWERFFANHPIKTMAELGSGSGGLSLFFLLQSYQYKFSFDTFDTVIPSAIETPVGVLLDLEGHFHQGDIFEGEKNNVVKLLASTPSPRLLFCDNGWKPREVETFAPFLSPGDFIAAHDWMTEIRPESIPWNILEDITWEANSLTRWFVRK